MDAKDEIQQLLNGSKNISPPTPPHKNDNNCNIIVNESSPMRPPLNSNLFRFYRDKLNDSAVTMDESAFLNTSYGVMEKSFLDSPMYKERHLKLVDVEKGLEMIGRELAKEKNIKWREFWSFLNEFIDLRSPEGLTKLEQYFMKKSGKKDTKKEMHIHTLCSALTRLEVEQNDGSSGRLPYVPKSLDLLLRSTTTNYLSDSPSSPATPPISSPNAFSAYLCVEKSWQTYANRMTNTIIHNLNDVVSINDPLKAELKRLKSLICSYKKDTRFFAVDFQLAHSRFAHLIIAYIMQDKKCDLVKVNTTFFF